MRAVSSFLCLALVLAASMGCEDPPGERVGPREAYLDFHRAVSSGKWERAVALLEPEAVAAFRALGASLAESVDSQDEPLNFFLRGVRAEVTAPLRSVTVERQDAEQAMVRVRAGACDQEGGICLEREVRLAFREGRWWIRPDLPERLHGRPGAVRANEPREETP
jgi:hypothetical protein